jgi:hypothetical protein
MLTLGDLISTGEEVVTLTGSQISEFEAMIKRMPQSELAPEVETSLAGVTKIHGYRHYDRHKHPPGNGDLCFGWFAGRAWYGEKAPKRTDWGAPEHGLNVQQLQFARLILNSVMAEFRGSATVLMDLDGHVTRPEALARFEETLVRGLHAYDTARTERLNFLEAEYRSMIDLTPMPTTRGRIPIFPFAAIRSTIRRVNEDSNAPREPIFPSGEDREALFGEGDRPGERIAKIGQQLDRVLAMTPEQVDQHLRKLGVTPADVRRHFEKTVEKAKQASGDRPYSPQLQAAIEYLAKAENWE